MSVRFLSPLAIENPVFSYHAGGQDPKSCVLPSPLLPPRYLGRPSTTTVPEGLHCENPHFLALKAQQHHVHDLVHEARTGLSTI